MSATSNESRMVSQEESWTVAAAAIDKAKSGVAVLPALLPRGVWL